MKNKVVLSVMFFALALGLVISGCSKTEESAEAEKPGKVMKQEQPAAAGGEQGKAQEQPEREAATGGEEVKSYRYVIETDMTGEGKSRLTYLVAPGKMNMRFDSQENGQWKTMSHMIMNGKDMYIIPPMGKTAMKMEASEEQMENAAPKDMMFAPNWNDFQKDHAAEGFVEKGKETVRGLECTKYEAKVMTAVETIYVDGKGMIRRIEVPGENGGPARTMDVVEVQLNPSFSDADFLPPKGYTVQEMPKMPGMPGGPR
jgi:outer membrane lipoprotein-sorting protein